MTFFSSIKKVYFLILISPLDKRFKKLYDYQHEHCSHCGRCLLNKHSTTETDILNISKKYISKNGLSSFNVRTITKECGISIGTLYNYFPSKSDLIIAAVESVWKEIFEPFTHFHTADCFPETVKCMYETIENGNSKYPGFFSIHSLNFASEEKKEGIQMMNAYFSRLKENLLLVLRNDKSVNRMVFTEDFSDEKFIDYVFTLLLSCLLNREDPTPLLAFISNYIYRELPH